MRTKLPLQHATFDVRDYVSPCIASLFRHYNVSHVRGGWYGGNESWSPMGLRSAWAALPRAERYPARWPSPILDFCLIDGGHTYRLAVRDWRTLRTACRVIAFHDVVNPREPGTIRLWRELTNRDSLEFATEFSSHLCVQQPSPAAAAQTQGPQKVMGIGILTRRDHA